MDIKDITIGQALELLKVFGAAATQQPQSPSPFQVGKIYLIRTGTMIDTGRVVEVTPQWIVLEDAAWIAETGRFSDSLKSCEFGEVEPFPDGRVIIGAGSITDACEIHTAPRSQK